jgi:hypothetical protein
MVNLLRQYELFILKYEFNSIIWVYSLHTDWKKIYIHIIIILYIICVLVPTWST